MAQELARFITSLIANYVDEHRTGGMCMSSIECEIMERCFMRGDYSQIEIYLAKKLK